MVVYPRWRGEHGCWRWHIWQLAGLSPLARGTRFLCTIATFNYRFIPAGAGNTTWRIFATPARTVYPRWRGEHRARNSVKFTNSGLSPLERGTRNIQRARRLRWRFIPAGAGNTHSITTDRQSPAVYPRWRGEHDI